MTCTNRAANKPVGSSHRHEPRWKRKGAARIPVKWTGHYRMLQSLRERLLGEEESERSALAEPIEPHSQSMGDSATDEFDHEMALCLLAREQNALEEVDAAIHRILTGTYGICEESGELIPAARLRVVPWTRRTREAQEKREREGTDRPPVIPPLESIQGRDAAVLSEVANPESEDLMAMEIERHQREASLRDLGPWRGGVFEQLPDLEAPPDSKPAVSRKRRESKRPSARRSHLARR